MLIKGNKRLQRKHCEEILVEHLAMMNEGIESLKLKIHELDHSLGNHEERNFIIEV